MKQIKRVFLWLLMVVLLCTSSFVLAENANTAQEKLDLGIRYLESYLSSGGTNKMITIQDVVDQIKKAGSFSYANSFYQYAELLNFIDQGKYEHAEMTAKFLRANEEFSAYLSSGAFQGVYPSIASVDTLIKYCAARKNESEGNYSEAVRFYIETGGFFDSYMRTMELYVNYPDVLNKVDAVPHPAEEKSPLIVTNIGDTALVELRADAGLTYQWFVKNPGQKKFSESSVEGNAYSFQMVKEKSGRQVYCEMTDTEGVKETTDVFYLVAAGDTAAYQSAVLEIAYGLEAGEKMLEAVYLTGTVASVDAAWSNDDSSITVTIVCDGHKKQPIVCYQMMGSAGKNIAVGDVVTVNGIVENSQGSVRFEAGCTLESTVKMQTPKPATQKPTATPTVKATKKPTATPKSWGAWSGWSTTAVSASSTRQVETKVEQETVYKTVYNYKKWQYKTTSGSTYSAPDVYTESNLYKSTIGWKYLTTDYALPKKGEATGKKYGGTPYYGDDANGNYWYANGTSQVATGSKEVVYYRYRDLKK